MDRKTAEDLFPGKTYEFEGRQYRESGEVRFPNKGDVCLSVRDMAVFRADQDFEHTRCPILTPVETSPRILTRYVSDAKAGDVYQYQEKLWTLTEWREPLERDDWISYSDLQNWGSVSSGRWSYGPRWIVTAYSPPVEQEAESVFIGDVLGEPDAVNSPMHYCQGGIEAIDVIEAFRLNYNRGNAVKYILRADNKNATLQDLKKSLWYIQREIANLEKEPTP